MRIVTVAFAMLASACAATGSAQVESVSGVASVIDGDTIEIHGQRIRLNGFDTPERGASCNGVNVYQKAAFTLSDFVGSKTVTCKASGKDRYDRVVATCSVAGTDIGEHMVSQGWGRDWPQYSARKYAPAEQAARQSQKGVWAPGCTGIWGNRTYD